MSFVVWKKLCSKSLSVTIVQINCRRALRTGHRTGKLATRFPLVILRSSKHHACGPSRTNEPPGVSQNFNALGQKSAGLTIRFTSTERWPYLKYWSDVFWSGHLWSSLCLLDWVYDNPLNLRLQHKGAVNFNGHPNPRRRAWRGHWRLANCGASLKNGALIITELLQAEDSLVTTSLEKLTDMTSLFQWHSGGLISQNIAL